MTSNNDKEIKIVCPKCNGDKYVTISISILSEPYDVYTICSACDGTGILIMYEEEK